MLDAKECTLVQFMIHDRSRRQQKRSRVESELSPKSLILEKEEADTEGWLDSNIYQKSKMGGFPLFWQNKKSITDEARTLLNAGYIHLLQFAFPGKPDALISGDWPYAGYVTHVFVDYPRFPKEIRYCWG
jgi:hypothetical protein